MKKFKLLLLIGLLGMSAAFNIGCASNYEDSVSYDWDKDWNSKENWTESSDTKKEKTTQPTTVPATIQVQPTTETGVKAEIRNALLNDASDEEIEKIIRENGTDGESLIATISFDVSDSESEELLKNVSVTYKNTTIGIEAEGIVDESASENLPYGRYEITLSKEGYRTETYRLKDLICENVIYDAKFYLKKE